jgi:hypothetical protein
MSPIATAPIGAAEARTSRGQEIPWPKPLAEAAYHGVLGEVVRAIEPQTEADPVAVLLHLLVMFGNAIGRAPHFTVGADVHHLNLFAAVVGTTSRGRKGMSRNQAQQLFLDLDEHWHRECVSSGLSSGEGLIWAIRDPIVREHPIKEKGRTVGYENVIEDAGIEDKRLLVVETELALTLRVMAREGSSLSAVMRQAWDSQDLRTLTKNHSARATAPHISVIGHVTADELRRYLDATEIANGFGNRFLWALVRRSRQLPHGGQPVGFAPFMPRLRAAIDVARRTLTLACDDPAKQLWETAYDALTTDRPGMFGAMTARAEPQVKRLACLYALLDSSAVIRPPHLQAALALWRYCDHSVAVLFGDRMGDPSADAILAELRRRAPERMTRTEISSEVFGRNKDKHEITRALELLVA